MICLLGAHGHVSRAYQRLFTKIGVPYRLIAGRVGHVPAQLASAILQIEPTFLINAAGYVGRPNVDACESNKAVCLQANASLPGIVAQVCAGMKLPWGHVSSGCIYNGDGPFHEDDPPNFTFRDPIHSFYTGCKALGEEVIAGTPSCYVWRLRMPFSHEDGPRNYLSKILRYARLLDARNSLSQIDDFCSATFACWTNRVPFGTYNVTNPGSITTREVVDLMRTRNVVPADRTFDFFESDAAFRATVATPRSNCVLDTRKLSSTGIDMPEVHEAVDEALRRFS